MRWCNLLKRDTNRFNSCWVVSFLTSSTCYQSMHSRWELFQWWIQLQPLQYRIIKFMTRKIFKKIHKRLWKTLSFFFISFNVNKGKKEKKLQQFFLDIYNVLLKASLYEMKKFVIHVNRSKLVAMRTAAAKIARNCWGLEIKIKKEEKERRKTSRNNISWSDFSLNL